MDSVSKLKASDHDLLITLVETVKNNHTSVVEKIADVKLNVEELKDNIQLKLVEHETRIRSLEQSRDEFDPKSVKEQVISNAKWISEFSITWKHILAASSAIGGVMATAITTLILQFRK